MSNKKTKRELFGELKALAMENGTEEQVSFIDHEITLLDKKASSKSAKVNNEQVALMDTIKKALEEIGEAVTVTDLQARSKDLEGYTNQRLSAMLKKLVDAKEVDKIVDKKKSYFKIA